MGRGRRSRTRSPWPPEQTKRALDHPASDLELGCLAYSAGASWALAPTWTRAAVPRASHPSTWRDRRLRHLRLLRFDHQTVIVGGPENRHLGALALEAVVESLIYWHGRRG